MIFKFVKEMNKQVYKSLVHMSKAFYDVAETYRYHTQEAVKKAEEWQNSKNS